jgi:formylglycine-generating enzyme required for sulfatase activity
MSDRENISKGCCVPQRAKTYNAKIDFVDLVAADTTRPKTVPIPETSKAILGTGSPRILNDGEELRAGGRISAFEITQTTITNRSFDDFVSATGYVTEAERFGWSFVFWSDVPKSIGISQGVGGAEWWRRIEGANWRDVNGPGSQEWAWHADHPVTQVSWNDAKAYAGWIGGRLPTEAEWEHAARGGLGDVPYPWGTKEPDDEEYFPCNIWQGKFPHDNRCKDGYKTTAPGRSFEPNGYGLYNVVGNVWEWTSDHFRIKSLKKVARQRQDSMKGYRVAKGGSFLCHRSYCWRYRISARSGNSPDTSTTHMGFRVVFEALSDKTSLRRAGWSRSLSV